MRFALVNGVPADSVPVTDRGLHYGDGLFETLAVRGAAAEFTRYHIERLARGCSVLGLPPPDAPMLEREIATAAAALREGVLKLIVTRGASSRGYRPPQDGAPTRLLIGYESPAHPAEWGEQGVRVRVCATRLSRNRRLAGLKHLNRLEQVLARAEWSDPEVAEGLMLDDEDHVVCATSANLFVANPEGLVTPRIDEAGIAGVVRRVLMEIAARDGIAVVERPLRLDELREASELMLSNSVIGLWRVKEIEGRPLRADALWRRLREALIECAGAPPR